MEQFEEFLEYVNENLNPIRKEKGYSELSEKEIKLMYNIILTFEMNMSNGLSATDV